MPPFRSTKPRQVRERTATYDATLATAPPSPRTGVPTLGGQRRLVLPPEVAKHLGLEVGDRLIYFMDPDGVLRIKSARKVVEDSIGLFADWAPERSAVQELFDERRREFELESGGG